MSHKPSTQMIAVLTVIVLKVQNKVNTTFSSSPPYSGLSNIDVFVISSRKKFYSCLSILLIFLY